MRILCKSASGPSKSEVGLVVARRKVSVVLVEVIRSFGGGNMSDWYWSGGRRNARDVSPVSSRLGLPLAVEATVVAALVIGASMIGMPAAGAQESEPGRLELLLAQSEGIVAPGRIEKQFEEETKAKSDRKSVV